MVQIYPDRYEEYSTSDCTCNDLKCPHCAWDGHTRKTFETGSTSSVPGRRILTPSSRKRASGQTRCFTPSSSDSNPDQDNRNPDTPLPSIERDALSPTDRPSTRSSASPKPSPGSVSTEQTKDKDAILQEISLLRNLRLTSPQTPPSLPHRVSRTPSIQVTPSGAPKGASLSSSRREDGLATDVAALTIKSQKADSLAPAELQESRSPSPSRRRRSGSGIRRERHQVESENPPEAFTRMTEVQEALTSARTLPRRMAAVLSSSNLYRENGSSVRKLYQQATRLNDFQLPSSRIVGLAGDSGVGKSSLINSLLDKAGLARASSSGTACTCAVTEYHFHERDDFMVHVDCFSMDELKQQYEELLRAHRDFKLLPKGKSSGEDSDTTDNDKQRLQKKSALATATFEASFGERLKEMPGILLSTPFEEAIAKMVDWASQVLPQQAAQNTFSTIEECGSWSRDLVSETDHASYNGNVRKSWPFIQKVRVYLKAYILSKGLIIADLPGLRDLNSARQAITERYIRQCHQIFIVARIDRAITDESIKQIFELARDLSKVDIVCTRSEDTQPREAIHDWPAERVKIEELQTSITSDEKEMASLKEEIDDLEEDVDNLTREEERQLRDHHRDYRKAERSKENHELELKRFIVTLRNDKVSCSLRQAYRNHPVATSLRVFCISNNVYWDNREKPSDVALPYLNFSGIVDLRRYCIGVVAQSRLEAIRNFIKDAIPALLGSIELWVNAGCGNASAERKQRVLDAVAAMQQELDELTSPVSRLNHISRTLEREFSNQIYLRMRRNSPQWSVDAGQASRSWESWHPSTYLTFCSNYGDHFTKAVGFRCWNKEAIQGMTSDLGAVWDSFTVDLAVEVDRINTVMTETFDKIFRLAESARTNESRATKSISSDIRTFASNLVHREHLTRYGIQQATDAFESNLSRLRSDTLSPVRTAFIGILMESKYYDANKEYGDLSDRRRKAIITRAFSSATLFDKHRHACREKYRIITRNMQEALVEVVNEQAGLLEADLQILRDGNEIKECERDEAFKRKVGEEVERVRTEVERLVEVVGGET